jgi:transcriptional regulator with XRE-family HTH domain
LSFGERLLKLLDEREISQKQFAENLDITYSTFNGYVNNKRECDFQTLKRIATYLDTSIDYLLGLTNHPQITHKGQLTHAEAELVVIYRQLSAEYQKLLLEQSKLLLKQNTEKNKK